MPPQQAYGLLDFIDDRFHFGAHRIPRCSVRRPGYPEQDRAENWSGTLAAQIVSVNRQRV